MSRIRLVALPVRRVLTGGQKGGTQFAYIALSQPEQGGVRHNALLDRVEALKTEGFEAYEAWRQLPEDNWRHKLVQWFERARAQIDPHELFVASLSNALHYKLQHAPEWEVELVYPGRVLASEEDMRATFAAMLKTTDKSVGRYLALYAAVAPVTAAMAILPGPNVFFAANALRLYSLWQCKTAVRNFSSISAPQLVLTPSYCPHLNWAAAGGEGCDGAAHDVSDKVAEQALVSASAPLPGSMVALRNFRNFFAAVSTGAAV